MPGSPGVAGRFRAARRGSGSGRGAGVCRGDGPPPGSWHLEQLASYGAPHRDPRTRVVTVAYWTICAELPAWRGQDAAAAALKPAEEIERKSVRWAFDHGRIVRDAVERARSGWSVIRPFSTRRWRGRWRGGARKRAPRSRGRPPRRRAGGRQPHRRWRTHRRTSRNRRGGDDLLPRQPARPLRAGLSAPGTRLSPGSTGRELSRAVIELRVIPTRLSARQIAWFDAERRCTEGGRSRGRTAALKTTRESENSPNEITG